MSTEYRFTSGRIILLILMAVGIVAGIYRLIVGLGATTNLSDAYPWGLWISFDVLTGVALAGGGFTISAAIYIFNIKKWEPLLRPAKLSAFVGYLIFIFGLFFDLGQPWRIWHPLVFWNTESVLFEVSWCVMLYTTVLAIDVFIMALERWKAEVWVNIFRNLYVFLIVAGIILSTLHQSSLGALYLLLPNKMSELWATGALGPLFFVSAIIGGMSMVALESLLSAKAYGRKPDMDVLTSLGKGLGITLVIYFAMRVTDLYARNVTVWSLDWVHFLFYLEIFGAVALPALLLYFPEIRSSRSGLLWCSGLAAFGVLLNRFNVSLTSYLGYREFWYFPSIFEIIITVGLVAMAILIFDFGMNYLPVHPEITPREAPAETT
jgi:Ni/Fe-hydrogenase subunit HybB-like protein